MGKDSWAKQEVTFCPSDMLTKALHNDPLVVSVQLHRYEVKSVLIDTEA